MEEVVKEYGMSLEHIFINWRFRTAEVRLVNEKKQWLFTLFEITEIVFPPLAESAPLSLVRSFSKTNRGLSIYFTTGEEINFSVKSSIVVTKDFGLVRPSGP